jgi:hypothetical protein
MYRLILRQYLPPEHYKSSTRLNDVILHNAAVLIYLSYFVSYFPYRKMFKNRGPWIFQKPRGHFNILGARRAK